MLMQRWRARWIEGEELREFTYDSLDNRMIARIDFRLKFPHAFAGQTAPKVYELEEVPRATSRGTLLKH